MQYVYLKNRFVNKNSAKISIKERGFRFGDGIFDSIKIKNHLLCDYNLHLKRIELGLKATKIAFDGNIIADIAAKLIKKNNIKNGFLRISISRGIGSKGYYPTAKNATLIIETERLRRPVNNNNILGISSYKKIPQNSLPINSKIMQGMNSTLASLEAKELGYCDVIMLNQNNNIAETSSGNFFAIKDGAIYTNTENDDILCGVIREKIINNPELPVKFTSINLSDLKEYDHIFITNIAIRIKEITTIENNKNVIWKKNLNINSAKILKYLKQFID